MSYILEALKRAERERRAGTSALLDEVPGTAAPSAAPGWQRWILPSVISALVAGLATYFLLGRGDHPVAGQTPPPAASAAAPTALAPPPAPVTAPGSATNVATTGADTGAIAQNTIEDDGRIASLDDLDDRPATSEAGNPPPDADEAAAETAPPRPSSASTHTRPQSGRVVAAGTAPADEAAPTSAGEDGTTGSADAPPAPQAAATDAPAAQNLREMPDAFRASFPPITVDVHAYSDNPAQRFVLIDGKRYHENDSLPQGPRIVGIVQEGIVFDWQGQRVLYAMNR